MNVGVTCPDCGTRIIVMPPDLFKAIGALSGVEGELQYQEVISEKKAKTGARLTHADVDGAYTCPACEQPGQLPPADELRRLAKEQGNSEE
jgi:hypothetical protein